jgi:DNA-binding protein HU-beta
MNKKELVTTIAEKMKVTAKVAETFVNTFTDTVSTELISGGSVRLQNFGSFVLTDVAARECRNPQTGKKLVIKAHSKPKFKFADSTKIAIKEKTMKK